MTSRGWALLEKLTLFFVRRIASEAFLVEPDYDKLISKLFTTMKFIISLTTIGKGSDPSNTTYRQTLIKPSYMLSLLEEVRPLKYFNI
ncbi:hypothetical protein C0966_01560 [Bacillus methanolicus]|nr:hypothetical protein [Bacillus methanolicus]